MLELDCLVLFHDDLMLKPVRKPRSKPDTMVSESVDVP